MKEVIRKAFRLAGYDLVRFVPAKHCLARRKRLIDGAGIDTVLDVGANVGQYGKELRDLGYKKDIISFEPLADAFQALKTAAERDPSWTARNFGLGDRRGTLPINVAGNSYSSSFLAMLPSHLDAAPESKYIRTESAEIRSLDDESESLGLVGKRILLKIDAQGYEERILAGAQRSLTSIVLMQLELSLTPLYEGEATYLHVCTKLQEAGYQLVSIEPGFADGRSGELIQIDGIFRRADSRPTA